MKEKKRKEKKKKIGQKLKKNKGDIYIKKNLTKTKIQKTLLVY